MLAVFMFQAEEQQAQEVGNVIGFILLLISFTVLYISEIDYFYVIFDCIYLEESVAALLSDRFSV